MRELYDFNAQMLNHLLNKQISNKIHFTKITNWHTSHPYYRLNYYNEIQISQVLGIYLLFNKDWLSQFNNIIEIGSYNGGLSSYIYDSKNKDAFFVSYDIEPTINQAKHKKENAEINFKIGDCFDPEVYKEIEASIKRPGKTLMICDGGNKTKEFIEFSSFLKKEDVIILHDYKDENYEELFFEAKNYWQWPYMFECSYDTIKQAVIDNKLDKYEYEKFIFYMWGAFVKS